MERYDYIIAGGGAAGLSLLLNILRSDLKNRSVLLVDREAKNQNDRTWCFWSDRPTGLEKIFYRSWQKIRYSSNAFDAVLPLENYSYHMVRGLDFYRHVFNIATTFSNVTVLLGSVTRVHEVPGKVSVTVNDHEYHGDYLFDSVIHPGDFHPDPRRYHNLKQHFLGWEIETEKACFDPHTPILFDFRTPQNGAMRFMYILPFGPNQAMVEYTLFSPTVLERSEYENALKHYLSTVLHIDDYRITGVEQGVIPMTDMPFPRKSGKRILNIGTKGGLVKPSTGESNKIRLPSWLLCLSLATHSISRNRSCVIAFSIQSFYKLCCATPMIVPVYLQPCLRIIRLIDYSSF
jgi:lycopene beta-cyclase